MADSNTYRFRLVAFYKLSRQSMVGNNLVFSFNAVDSQAYFRALILAI